MHPTGKSADIRVLLFDVGGVLVELGGINIMLRWLKKRMTEEEMWRRWLHSSPVRAFETGRIDGAEFAQRVVEEFGIDVEPARFLESFTGWPTGLYPGTLDLLAQVPPSYRRALLSNSNALHWPRVIDEMGLGALFESRFVSHLTGNIKPDAAAFAEVVETLECAPAQVLFLDDNRLNIEAAAVFGMHAVRVRGPLEAQRALTDFGIIPSEG